MSSRATLLVGVTVAAVALIAGLFLVAGNEGDGTGGALREASPLGPRPRPSGTAASLAAPGADPGVTLASDEDEVELEEAEIEGGRVAASASEEGLDEALWFEGRIKYPQGTPNDERTSVVAHGRRFKGRQFHKAEVKPDGTFRVAFAPHTTSGRFDLESTYLYLPERKRERLNRLEQPHVLEPALGGRVEVSFLLPLSDTPSHALLEKVSGSIRGQAEPEELLPNSDWVRRSGDITDSLTLVFDALRPMKEATVSVESPDWISVHEGNVAVERGLTTRVEITLAPAAHLKGHIVSPAGVPVQRAQVAALQLPAPEEGEDEPQGEPRQVESDTTEEDGVFDIGGLAPGAYKLEIEHPNYLKKEFDIGALAAAERREGLSIALDEGGVITGIVQWSDSKPAPLARIQIAEAGNQWYSFQRFGDQQLQSGPDGRFRITGLTGSLYVLEARIDRAVDTELSGDPKDGDRAFHARKDSVRPGEEAVLVLEEGWALVGRVTDAAGEPVLKFNVRAMPEMEERWMIFAQPGAVATEKFETEDGRFVLAGVRSHLVNVSVTAHGFVTTERGGIDLAEPGEIAFTLQRPGQLRGTVVGPDGAPVAKARIESEFERGSLEMEIEMAIDQKNSNSAKDGSFRIRRVPSGRAKLRAEHPQYLDSETLELDVAPGQTIEGVVLHLRAAGGIEGELHDSIELREGRSISVRPEAGGGGASTSTDGRGRFEVHGLESGTYTVVLDGEDGARFQRDFGRGFRRGFSGEAPSLYAARALVEVRAGDVTHVVLGEPPADAASVFVRVLEGERGAEGVIVAAESDTDRGSDVAASARTDGEGRCKLLLARGQPYVFHARDGQVDFPFEREVPDAAETSFEFELPVQSIRGTVRGDDGDALTQVAVRLYLDGEEANSGSARETTTDDEGGFAFRRLRPGRYELMVGGVGDAPWRWWQPNDADEMPWAPEVVGGLDVNDSSKEIVQDVELVRAGEALAKIVDRAGEPIANAHIEARDSRGNLVVYGGFPRSDTNGYTRVLGLPPGRVMLRAIDNERTGKDVVVPIESGEKAEVEVPID